MLLVASGLFSMFYFASIYLQEMRGYSPLKAGFAFLPFTFGIVIGAGASQPLIKRIGIRAVSFAGMTMGAVGMLLLHAARRSHSTYFASLFPSIVVMSIGMGMTFVPLTLLATTNVEADDAGLASGLFNTSQQVGGALGLAVLSTLAASQTSSPRRVGHRRTGGADARLPRRVRRRRRTARRGHRRASRSSSARDDVAQINADEAPLPVA